MTDGLTEPDPAEPDSGVRDAHGLIWTARSAVERSRLLAANAERELARSAELVARCRAALAASQALLRRVGDR